MTSADIVELRSFISGEFGNIHSRLDVMDGRFDAMEGRLGRVEDALSELRDDQRGFQDYVVRDFADFSTRLRRVEVTGEAMRHDFRVFGEGLTGVDRKVDVLRLDMNSGLQGLREEMRFGFLAYGERMDAGV